MRRNEIMAHCKQPSGQNLFTIVGQAQAVSRHYTDLELADAVNVALAAEYRTDAILTLDRRDFRAMRPLTPHKWFRLLPDHL